ncbi:MAG: TlpA disulfide reductase family protein [Gemmatimonadaceae bacterium]
MGRKVCSSSAPAHSTPAASQRPSSFCRIPAACRKPARLILALAALVVADVAEAQRLQGSQAPAIALRTLDGKPTTLAQMRGHPVVLSFWATWCGPCRQEFAQLVALHREAGPSGLRILAINGRDQEQSTRDVRQFVKQSNARFDVVLDTRGAARQAYRIVFLPTTIFVDSAGTIRKIHSGAISASELASGISLIRPE